MQSAESMGSVSSDPADSRGNEERGRHLPPQVVCPLPVWEQDLQELLPPLPGRRVRFYLGRLPPIFFNIMRYRDSHGIAVGGGLVVAILPVPRASGWCGSGMGWWTKRPRDSQPSSDLFLSHRFAMLRCKPLINSVRKLFIFEYVS